jgi:hypothetical protein
LNVVVRLSVSGKEESAMRSRVGVVAMACLVVACSDKAPVAPVGKVAIGTMSFAYSGVVSGSFSVQGKAPSLSSLTGWNEPFAFATIDDVSPPPSPVTRVSSNTGMDKPTYHTVDLHIPTTDVGTTTVTESCFVPGTIKCPFASIVFLASTSPAKVTYTCTVKNGTFTIANRTDTRVAGTFGGSGECLHLETLERTPLRVTGGVFDVPIIRVGSTILE